MTRYAPVHDRIVEDDKIITAAGVSTGIDMAFYFAEIASATILNNLLERMVARFEVN